MKSKMLFLCLPLILVSVFAGSVSAQNFLNRVAINRAFRSNVRAQAALNNAILRQQAALFAAPVIVQPSAVVIPQTLVVPSTRVGFSNFGGVPLVVPSTTVRQFVVPNRVQTQLFVPSTCF